MLFSAYKVYLNKGFLMLVSLSDTSGDKYKGIYTSTKENGVISFFIAFKDENNKVKRLKVGETPSMNKTIALRLLNDKKEEIKELKSKLKSFSSSTILTKRTTQKQINYSLNDLADIYLKSLSPTSMYKVKSTYDFHLKKEPFAEKPVVLITAEDLNEFLERKKDQRADKRINNQTGKTLEEKELQEYHANVEKIVLLKDKIEVDDKDAWILKNQISFLQAKNDVLALRVANDQKLLRNKNLKEYEIRALKGVLSVKTIKEIVFTAGTIINYATTEKLINTPNPFMNIVKKLKTDNIRPRYLSKEEIKLFLDEAKRISSNKKHNNIYLMALLGLSLASRQETILTIKIKDIDFENGIISLKNHKVNKYYNGVIANQEIVDELKRVIDDRDGEEYLFVNYTGERPYRYPRILADILDYTVNYKKPYYEWLCLKDLRNTVASHLAMAGVSLKHIQEVLDHSSIRTTERYAHLAPNTASSAVKNFVGSYLKE